MKKRKRWNVTASNNLNALINLEEDLLPGKLCRHSICNEVSSTTTGFFTCSNACSTFFLTIKCSSP